MLQRAGSTVSLLPSEPEEVGLSSARLTRIAEFFGEAVERGRVPGAVIGIARRGKLAYLEAFGLRDPQTREPMAPDAIFSIASMTKPLTTVAALMLFEQGRLFLLDPVETYLPSFARRFVGVQRNAANGESVVDRVPAERSISIQDLMRHTSGLTYGNRGDTAIHKMYPLSSITAATMTGEEFLRALETLPLLHQPGAVWEYGFSTDVLGLVVEAVAKQSLSSFLQEHLFAPLRMNDTHFVIPQDKAGRYAKAFRSDPETGLPQSIPDATQPAKFECGGAGAVSTAGDYIRFAQMLLNKGELDGTRILARKTIELMTANHLDGHVQNNIAKMVSTLVGYTFGLGVAVRREKGLAPLPGSPGDFTWTGVFGTYFLVDPKEELVVVYMSQVPGSPDVRAHYRQAVSTLVQQAIID